jgi:hypothetical protein
VRYTKHHEQTRGFCSYISICINHTEARRVWNPGCIIIWLLNQLVPASTTKARRKSNQGTLVVTTQCQNQRNPAWIYSLQPIRITKHLLT